MRGTQIVDYDFDVERDQFIAEYGEENVWLYDDYNRAITTDTETGDLLKGLANKIMNNPKVKAEWEKWNARLY